MIERLTDVDFLPEALSRGHICHFIVYAIIMIYYYGLHLQLQ